MRRRDLIIVIAGCAAAQSLAAYAQQATKVPRIGILTPGRADNSDASLLSLNAFVAGVRELGYIEGRNFAFEHKFANGSVDRLGALAAELVEHQVDVIVANSTPAAR